MSYAEKINNKAYISGEILTKATFSHEIYGEGFYEMSVGVKRLSGQADVLPVTVSERLIEANKLTIGSIINAEGQFRSYNKMVDGKSKLMLTVFVREIVAGDEYKNPNSVILSGYVCKPTVYRTTPFNREIADILLAVNRAYNKSDYIPCIAWGRNARFVKSLAVGEKIALCGRIQSRDYTKKFSETESKVLTAYEVSVSRIAACDGLDEFESSLAFCKKNVASGNEPGAGGVKNGVSARVYTDDRDII